MIEQAEQISNLDDSTFLGDETGAPFSGAQKKFIPDFNSLEEVIQNFGLSSDAKIVGESNEGDMLKKDSLEWIFKSADGKKESVTAQTTGEALREQITILGSLKDKGFAFLQKTRPDGESSELGFYFADEKGHISYKIAKVDLEKKSLRDYFDLDSIDDDDLPLSLVKKTELSVLNLNSAFNIRQGAYDKEKKQESAWDNFWDNLLRPKQTEAEALSKPLEQEPRLMDIFGLGRGREKSDHDLANSKTVREDQPIESIIKLLAPQASAQSTHGAEPISITLKEKQTDHSSHPVERLFLETGINLEYAANARITALRQPIEKTEKHPTIVASPDSQEPKIKETIRPQAAFQKESTIIKQEPKKRIVSVNNHNDNTQETKSLKATQADNNKEEPSSRAHSGRKTVTEKPAKQEIVKTTKQSRKPETEPVVKESRAVLEPVQEIFPVGLIKLEGDGYEQDVATIIEPAAAIRLQGKLKSQIKEIKQVSGTLKPNAKPEQALIPKKDVLQETVFEQKTVLAAQKNNIEAVEAPIETLLVEPSALKINSIIQVPVKKTAENQSPEQTKNHLSPIVRQSPVNKDTEIKAVHGQSKPESEEKNISQSEADLQEVITVKAEFKTSEQPNKTREPKQAEMPSMPTTVRGIATVHTAKTAVDFSKIPLKQKSVHPAELTERITLAGNGKTIIENTEYDIEEFLEDAIDAEQALPTQTALKQSKILRENMEVRREAEEKYQEATEQDKALPETMPTLYRELKTVSGPIMEKHAVKPVLEKSIAKICEQVTALARVTAVREVRQRQITEETGVSKTSVESKLPDRTPESRHHINIETINDNPPAAKEIVSTQKILKALANLRTITQESPGSHLTHLYASAENTKTMAQIMQTYQKFTAPTLPKHKEIIQNSSRPRRRQNEHGGISLSANTGQQSSQSHINKHGLALNTPIALKLAA